MCTRAYSYEICKMRKPPHAHLATSLFPPSVSCRIATRPHLCHLPLEVTPRRPWELTDEDYLVASNRAEHVVEGVVGQLVNTRAVNALERSTLAIMVPIGGVSASSLNQWATLTQKGRTWYRNPDRWKRRRRSSCYPGWLSPSACQLTVASPNVPVFSLSPPDRPSLT